MIFAAKPLAVVVGYMVTWFGWVDNLLFLSMQTLRMAALQYKKRHSA